MAATIPIVVAIVSALAGLLTWTWQREKERISNLQQRRFLLYEKLLNSVVYLTASDAAPFFVESQQAWLYASDDVLKALNAYAMMASSSEKTNEKLNALLGELLISIRQDSGLPGRTDIDKDWVGKNFRAVTAPRELIQAYVDKARSPG